MDLSALLPLIDSVPAYRELADRLKHPQGMTRVAVLDAARPFVIAALHSSLEVPIMLITAQPDNARKLHEQLLAWKPSPLLKLLVEPDALPYQRIASDISTGLERVQTLSVLANAGRSADAPLVVASAPAVMAKTARADDFMSTIHSVETGTDIPPLKLLERWSAMGYTLESAVSAPGTMSHRGGIVDVYPPTSRLPARIEFFGNSVESIRLFDPATQRSVETVSSVTISPASEMLGHLLTAESAASRLDLSGLRPEMRERFQRDLALLENRQTPDDKWFYAPLFSGDSVLSYLPQNGLLILDEPPLIRQASATLDREARELRQEKIASGDLPHDFPTPYFTWDEMEAVIKDRPGVTLGGWGVSEAGITLDFSPAPVHAGQLPSFIARVKQQLTDKQRIIVISNQAERLSELVGEQDIFAPAAAEITRVPAPGTLTLVHGSLEDGWVTGSTHLYTDAEIFGFVKQRRLARKRPVARRVSIDIATGDYVVHIEHGIARFSGVVTRSENGTGREYLVLLYASGDRLYVPSDQIDRVARYVGASELPPALSRLGSQEWAKTKQRVSEDAERVARELLDLYASREVVPGFAFSTDTVWQQEMEASFIYVETPDQVSAQRQVKADMEKPRPMDRLICGDVGYGKTEIAIRAAFKAVMDGKQVAVLVPTTVLAEQHFVTFSQRLAAFPVRVEVLSRFRTSKEQQAIVRDLSEGKIDVCIGTHRLLQKDVTFKNLGLVVVDEEQRFGVVHKEFLKRLRKEVDVLTLSATPIPRTLHLALAGVRDMSVIETPPEDRLPVKTYVAEWDDRLVREAVLREMERNGQVFVVHNRVHSIASIADKLRKVVPEARIAVAHGQIPEAELERVMTEFTRRKSDVLVCTTIIESGLDMPNANTIIINRADRLGLTQLYQLRGRVGRGAEMAYAYLLYDRENKLTPTAQKRLKTIYEAAELGAGFNIAMKDLEIRGAGNLLGTAQSGNISAVGFSLYTDLLAQAVEDLKAKQAGKPVPAPSRIPEPSVDLPLPAYIPEDYVTDLDTRLALYQNLTRVNTVEQVDALAGEFRDRFGAAPPEVNNLLYALRIKVLAMRAGIESISTHDSQIIMKLFEGMRFDSKKLEPLLRYGIKPGTNQLRLSTERANWQGVLEDVLGRVG